LLAQLVVVEKRFIDGKPENQKKRQKLGVLVALLWLLPKLTHSIVCPDMEKGYTSPGEHLPFSSHLGKWRARGC
jgi:hypothetical protein